MTPVEFKEKWGVTNGELMSLLNQSSETVTRWFSKGKGHREPSDMVCERLTMIDVQWQKWQLEERYYNPYVRSLYEIVKNRKAVNGK